ncbi:MAG: PaaI family thioesterase [Deferrisomatales bacterium]
MERPLPHSTWCYVCGSDNPLGLRLTLTAEGDRVRARYTPEVHRQGYRGVTHGGVVGTVLDEIMGWAPCLATGRFYFTAELTVRYLLPFPVGREMVVEAWAEKVTSRLALVRGEVRDEAGAVYATAEGKFRPLSEADTRAVAAELTYGPDTLRPFGG